MTSSLRRHGIVADTSSTGSGKTFMALAACQALGLRPLVVAPKATLPSWMEASLSTGTDILWATNYERLLADARKFHGKAEKYELWGYWEHKNRNWAWSLRPGENHCIIFDEAHRLSGQKSQTSRMLVAATLQRIPTILLSATLADSPLKMRAIGHALGECEIGWEAWTGWCFANGVIRDNFNALKFVGGKHTMAKIRERIGSKMTGLDSAEIPGFPESRVITKAVPTTAPDLDQLYREELIELKAESELPVTDMLRTRQISELGKVDAVVELTKDAVEEGNSVVIFPAFQDTAYRLAERLHLDAPLTGKTPGAEQQYLIDQFQANRSHVIICMINKGLGINLQDLYGRPRVSYVMPTWNPVDLIQSLGRIPRTGGKSKCLQTILFANGCETEGRIRRAIDKKVENIEAITESDLHITL